MVLNTKKWRRAMDAVRHNHGWGLLPLEKGWTVETVKPLGKPARHLLKRIQDQYVIDKLLTAKYADGTLNTKTKNLLIPPQTPADKAVSYALSQAAAKVHESPWGSNNGADVHRYESSTGAYGAPWCASFFWYCWIQAGYKGPTSAGAWNTTDSYGHPIPGIKYAKAGDGVSFNIGEGHIGMYLSHDSTEVTTVDGNTSNEVAVRKRPITEIHSICRPL